MAGKRWGRGRGEEATSSRCLVSRDAAATAAAYDTQLISTNMKQFSRIVPGSLIISYDNFVTLTLLQTKFALLCVCVLPWQVDSHRQISVASECVESITS